MFVVVRVIFVSLCVFAFSGIAVAQPLLSDASAVPPAVRELPEAPIPDASLISALQEDQAVGQSRSSAQSPAPAAPKSRRETAEEQMKQEEKQRLLGVLPNFNVSYISDAVSLTASQKMRLAFRSAIDPWTFAAGFLVAGVHEATDSDTGFGWGPAGYGKRSGAAYLDAFDGGIIGNGILPSILHQDPRFFRLGHGTFQHRVLYAASTAFICKHDNTGRWEPNYSNVLGNVAAGALSNLYYPSNQSGFGQALSNAFIVTAEGAIASSVQEFWPDISRRFLHRDPTHGRDALVSAADETKKSAEK